MGQSLSPDVVLELQTQLQEAVVACTERCLYQSAKWYAQLLCYNRPIPDFAQILKGSRASQLVSGIQSR